MINQSEVYRHAVAFHKYIISNCSENYLSDILPIIEEINKEIIRRAYLGGFYLFWDISPESIIHSSLDKLCFYLRQEGYHLSFLPDALVINW